MLSERQAAILQFIIDDYIETAAPVGSEHFVRSHHLGLSPATIRNEMARLEEEEYVFHPHTSAGRVPSDKGYRYYVETLMQDTEVGDEEKLRIRHQFHQASADPDGWLQLAASVLAQSVRNLAMVTAPRATSAILKHLELIELGEITALLVLLTQDITLHQQLITVPEPIGQQELTGIAGRFNRQFVDKGAMVIEEASATLNPIEARIALAVAEIMKEERTGQYPEPHFEGIRNVLQQPEFSQSEKMLNILEAMEEHNLSRVIPFDRIMGTGVSVVIGSENRDDSMRECSVVVTSYGLPERGTSGALAILGPTRMQYPRAIAAVRYLGALMSELMFRLYD